MYCHFRKAKSHLMQLQRVKPSKYLYKFAVLGSATLKISYSRIAAGMGLSHSLILPFHSFRALAGVELRFFVFLNST